MAYRVRGLKSGHKKGQLKVQITLDRKDLRNVTRRFKRLPIEMQKGGIEAFETALKAFTDDAKRRAPKASGKLRNAIKYYVIDRKTVISAFIVVDVPYAAAVEFGAKRHKKKYKKFLINQLERWAELVGKPGEEGAIVTGRLVKRKQPAQPFMRPALRANRKKVVDQLVKDLRKAIKRAVKPEAKVSGGR